MAGKNVKLSIFCYFFIAVVLDGLQRLSGLFVLELLQTKNVSRQSAFIPFISSWAVSNVIASFSENLIDNKKSEYVILTGVLLSATGAAFCILATNIIERTVFWGLIFGSGYGLASPHISKHLKYTDCTELSFILQVTPSLGVVIMSFALSVLNIYYELKGSLLIFCGVILNYLPLALAAAYDIKIFIPNIKWRVRKKSKQYSVSKQDEGKTVSIESFMNSLEPDPMLKIFKNGDLQHESKINKSDPYTNIELGPVGRKRSETRSNALQGLEVDNRIFSRNKIHSQMLVEIKNYENERKVFEWSFNNKDILHEEIEHTSSITDKNHDIINMMQLETNFLNKDTEFELNLKNKTFHKVSECKINRTIDESNESLDNHTGNNVALDHTCAVKMNLHNLDLSNGDNILQTNKSESKTEILSETKVEEKVYHDLPIKFETKSLQKENLQFSSHFENKLASNLPLDIKVHVEECTFHTSDDDWEDGFNKYLTARKNSENNLNSHLFVRHNDTDFCNSHFSVKVPKSLDTHKPKLSNIYSISENSELGDKSKNVGKKHIEENNMKTKGILIIFKSRSSIVCLCILLINIIFEINLVTLLTMFADFGSDIDNITSDFKWILMAFGVGGLIGKICCCRISRTIPEKCHAICVVLFLLNGLSITGVLYSTNLNWLAGFYCILGALEGGITYIIPKLILEYVNTDAQSTLSFLKRFLSGIAIICIPYIIGLFRDEMGEYEFLLQILSCSSLLCALLAYSLQYLRTASNKRISPIFGSKMEIA